MYFVLVYTWSLIDNLNIDLGNTFTGKIAALP